MLGVTTRAGLAAGRLFFLVRFLGLHVYFRFGKLRELCVRQLLAGQSRS